MWSTERRVAAIVSIVLLVGVACDRSEPIPGAAQASSPSQGPASSPSQAPASSPTPDVTLPPPAIDTAGLVPVDPDAKTAGVSRTLIPMGAALPDTFTASNIELLEVLRGAAIGAIDLGSRYKVVTSEFVPNFRLLETSSSRSVRRDVILASARLDGYGVAFDHPGRREPHELRISVDLFANPTGASIAVRRSASFVSGTVTDRRLPPTTLGEEGSVLRFRFDRGGAVLIAFRRGRIVGGVLVTYLSPRGARAVAVEAARALNARLEATGL